MRALALKTDFRSAVAQFATAAVATSAFLLALVPMASAQNVDCSPATLSTQRAAIILKATHAPIADVENELNHLALLSERCRVESGAKACGLSDKPLESNSLDERYAYYVRQPMDAHASGHQAKVDKHNWAAPPAPPR
jgi:hypothetical protein